MEVQILPGAFSKNSGERAQGAYYTLHMPTPDEIFMNEAVKQAMMAAERDEVPVGAVITHNNNIIARAHNQVEMLHDPTAHAEMIAITQAANFLSNKWLYDCSLYVTIEPCSMCAGALVLSRMSKLYFGAADPKTGACGSVTNIVNNKKLNHHVDVVGDIAADACGHLLSEFFEKKRALARGHAA